MWWWSPSDAAELGLRIRAEGGAHFRAMLAEKGQLDAAADQLTGMRLRAEADTSTVGLLGSVVGAGSPTRKRSRCRSPAAASPRNSPTSPSSGGSGGTQCGRTIARTAWTSTVSSTPSNCPSAVRCCAHRNISAMGSTGTAWIWIPLPMRKPLRPPRPTHSPTSRYLRWCAMAACRADRFWEMEDARIDFGATDVSALDTGRLLLISFATVYGNDWFLTPLEVPVGSLTTIEQMRILDVFERNHLIKRAGEDEPSWSMYTLHSDDPDHWAAKSLLMMPCTQGHRGEPLEQIRLTRDELANLAWAVQHDITDDRANRSTAATGGFGTRARRARGTAPCPLTACRPRCRTTGSRWCPSREAGSDPFRSRRDECAGDYARAEGATDQSRPVAPRGGGAPRGGVRAAPTGAGALVRRIVAQLGAPGEICGQRGKFERTGLRQRLAHGSVARVTDQSPGGGLCLSRTPY